MINFDEPGVGFNDPTPADPVGGNPGTTLGEQRLFLFEYAADLWGAQLKSTETIYLAAFFGPLQCDATSGVLGSASPLSVFANFPNAPLADTWYVIALADALARAKTWIPASSTWLRDSTATSASIRTASPG